MPKIFPEQLDGHRSIHQRSGLSDHRQGHDLSIGLQRVPQRRVLTHRRLPDQSLPQPTPVRLISNGSIPGFVIEQSAELVERRSLVVQADMAVDVHRHFQCAVPHDVHHRARRNAQGE
jgi:hypothetical protein